MRSIRTWQLLGFAVTSLAGTVLHFLYDLLGRNILIAPFSGVNESTWEHMKLLFWPLAVYALIQSFFFREREDFWCIKARGILLGLSLIPVLFYTYNGAIGKSPDFINIAIFFVSAAAVFIYETRLWSKEKVLFCSTRVAVCLIFIISLLFIIFTFNTPTLGIFRDPITGTYGI